jgi:hypothetical protein
LLQLHHARTRSNPREQLVAIHRLLQKVVGPRLEPLQHVGRFRPHRDEDRVEVVPKILAANPAAQFQPIQIRHFPVGHQEPRVLGFDHLHCRAAIACAQNLIAFRFQPFG